MMCSRTGSLQSQYTEAEMQEANQVNANIVKMFGFLGVVALMLSVTGTVHTSVVEYY